jgi:Tannase and feruloyl esterase.
MSISIIKGVLQMKRSIMKRIVLGLCLGAVLTGATLPAISVEAAAADLPKKIAAEKIGLPTSGVEVTEVTLKSFPDDRLYTAVLAKIHPVDRNAPDINIEVALPADWNGKMVQFGGGGFDGSIQQVAGHAPGESGADLTPLERGYATYGSDSGHAGEVWDAEFAANQEALRNYAHGAVKKTHDAALEIVTAFYGRQPERSYFIGGSGGGRESLQAAQRYGKDYDGIVTFYPVLNMVPKAILDSRNANALQKNNGEGWLSAEDFKVINRTYLEMTDELDGRKDNLVSNYKAAQAKTPEVLAELDKKLSPAKMETLRTFLSPMEFAYPLANGFRVMPGYVLGQEMRDKYYNQFGSAPGKRDGDMAFYSNGIAGWLTFGHGNTDMTKFDYRQHQPELQASSELLDATNIDLGKLKNHGGKLIILHGTSDQVVTPEGSIQYYKGLQQHYGQQKLDEFVRFYLVPGFGHGYGEDFTMGRSLLTDVDEWVTQGKAPEALEVMDDNAATRGRKQVLVPYTVENEEN